MKYINNKLILIALNWEKIGKLGIQHCKDANESKTIRFMNYISLIGIIIILSYAFAALFQSQGKYMLLFVIEVGFSLLFFSILYMNRRGWFLWAKVVGLLISISFVSLLSIVSGNILGGAYTLLVISILPMILFKERNWYSLFFVLHILAFFGVYYYYQHFESIIRIAKEDIQSNYILAVLVMFALVYFFMQYFIGTNNNYEKQLLRSRQLIETKNREILDSIEYARRIQTAILPPPRVVKEFLKNSFILYLPKDIVAGDFYWLVNIDDIIYFAACDCTGHGVPGAMVSVVCNNALNRAINEFSLRSPGAIFDKVRELVLENFAQSDEKVSDGMDASLCSLNREQMQLQWAGANNPLWIYRKEQSVIEEFVATKQPIGSAFEPKLFKTHEISLQHGDIIYMFTDGYADQFGGAHSKKYTKKRFRELLLSIAHLPMEEQRANLFTFHNEYRGSNEQVDDICVIGVKV